MKIEEIYIWETFQAVATLGNFTKAAASLKIPVPQVSKRIAKLESQLGIRLFQRSTRVVRLTDEGKALLPKVTSTLDDLIGIENYFENQGQLTGTIRITTVPFIAHNLLISVLSDFSKLHPKIHLDIDLSENIQNLYETQKDIAIRIQEPEDSDMVYRKLVPNNLIFCASPKYLRSHNEPLTKPAHLKNHKALMLDIHGKCKFKDGSGALKDFIKQKAVNCENGAFLTDLALNDFGVLVRSIWDVKAHIEKGRLIQVLNKYPLEAFGSIYSVIPSRRYLTPRVRAFMDFLIEKSLKWN